MLLTLTRRQEAALARWCDVNMEARTWTIPETKNGEPHMARALAVKSVTAPVALGIGGQIGLRQDLVVVGVMASGLFGMVIGPALLALGRLKGDHAVIGAALGCASHGLGTARAFEVSQTAGAFASVCMGLSALAYGVILPLALRAV